MSETVNLTNENTNTNTNTNTNVNINTNVNETQDLSLKHNITVKSDAEIKSKLDPNKSAQIDLALNKLYKQIKDTVSGVDLTTGRIISLVSSTMQFAGQFKSLEGLEKRKLVKDLIRRVIVEEGKFATPREQEAILFLLEFGLGTLIDQLYMAAKQLVDYGIKKADDCKVGCFNRKK